MNGRPPPAATTATPDEALAMAMLSGESPDPGDEGGSGVDEWTLVSLTSRAPVPERPNVLGGPIQRTVTSMAASTVTIRRKETVVEEAEPPRAPSDEERQRTARRTTEVRPERESPAMVLLGVALLVGLLTFFVFLFGARLFG